MAAEVDPRMGETAAAARVTEATSVRVVGKGVVAAVPVAALVRAEEPAAAVESSRLLF